MPRKSAAARMTQVIARSRLEPPSGLSSRERALFREVTDSLTRDHLKLEDVPLVAIYVKGLSQVEIAARELAGGSTDAHWLNLQNAGLKLVTAMAIRLRIGPKGRSPSNARKPNGTAVSSIPVPWEGNSRLPSMPTYASDERRFSDLRAMRDRRAAEQSSGWRADQNAPNSAAPIAIEAPDVAAIVGAVEGAERGSA